MQDRQVYNLEVWCWIPYAQNLVVYGTVISNKKDKPEVVALVKALQTQEVKKVIYDEDTKELLFLI